MVVVGDYAYVASSDVISKVTLSSGAATILAGSPGVYTTTTASSGGSARFYGTQSLATDGSSLFTVDWSGQVIQVDLSTGGTSIVGSTGSSSTQSVAYADGHVFISRPSGMYQTWEVVELDPSTSAISVVTTLPTNEVTTAVAADDDALWIAATDGGSSPAVGKMYRVDTDTWDRTLLVTDPMAYPRSIASAGDYLFVGLGTDHAQVASYRKSDGDKKLVAGTGNSGHRDGVGAQAWFKDVTAIASDGTDLFVADDRDNRVRRVSAADPLPAAQPDSASVGVPVTNSVASVLAGSGSSTSVAGSATTAGFDSPNGAVVVGGYVYVAANDTIMKVDKSSGTTTVLAGSPGSYQQVYAPTGVDSRFYGTGDLATDGTFLYTVDDIGDALRISIESGAVSHVASTDSHGGHGVTYGADGDLYVTYQGTFYSKLWRVDLRDATATLLDTRPVNEGITGITSDEDAVWISTVSCACSTAISRLVRYPYTAPEPATVFASGAGYPTFSLGLESMGGDLYVGEVTSTSSYELARISTATGQLAGILPLGVDSAADIASDGRRLFVTGSGWNQVLKLVTGPPPTVSAAQSMGPGSAFDGGTVPGGGAPGQCGCVASSLERTSATSAAAAEPVNTATGAFYDVVSDAALAGAGVTFAFTRTYNSNDATSDRLGPGWTDPYQASLDVPPSPGDVTFRAEDGAQAVFTRNGDASYSPPTGVRSSLEELSGGGFRVTTADHRTTTFDSSGHLTSELDRHGVGLSFTWSSGRITTITDAAGRQVALGYNGSGLLTSLTLPDARHVDYTYSSGRLSAVTDLGGKVWTYGYDSAGRLVTVTDPRGHDLVTNVYSSAGRVVSQTDAEDRTTTFDWDAGTQTATVTNPDGGDWEYRYEGNVLVEATDPDENTTGYTYDEGLRLAAVEDAAGRITSYTYDELGNRTSQRSPHPVDAVTRWTYDNDNNLTQSTDPLGHDTDYGYNGSGDLTSATTASGARTTWDYHADGTLDWMTETRGNQSGASASDYRTHYDYDGDANLVSVTSPLGRETTFGYDSVGRRTSVTDPRGNESGAAPEDYTTTTDWNSRDLPQEVTDPLGHTTVSAYDDAGNLSWVTDPDSNTTTLDYDDANQLIQVTDPLGNDRDFSPDWAGRINEVVDEDGNTTTNDYDQLGRLVDTVSPRGNLSGAAPAEHTTSYTYDEVGNRLTITHPLPGGGDATITTGYDVLNRPVAVTDAGGSTTRHHYDLASQETTTTDPLGAVTTRVFDADGRVVSVTDPNEHESTYDYDIAGNLLTRTDPLNRDTSWTYNRDGEPTTMSVPGSLVTTWSHDAAGNTAGTDYSDSGTPDVSIDYDPLNRRTSMTDGTGSTSYTYTDAGRLDQVTNGHGDSVGYGYDDAGRMTTITYPGSLGAVTYTYSDAGLMTGLTDWASRQFTFGYNHDGQLNQIAYPNGVDTDLEYDIAGRLTDIDAVHTATAFEAHDYTYNPRGLLTTATDDLGGNTTTRDYTWDDAAQLATSPAGSYAFDPAHQITTQPATGATVEATYDAAGQLTTTSTGTADTDYTFNTRGDRTTADPDSGPSTDYDYGQDNALTGWSQGSTSVAFGYDGDRLRASVTRGSGGGATTTHNVWDVAGPLPLMLGDGDHWYVYGPEASPLAQIATSGGGIDYLHHDITGSVRAITNSAGTLGGTATYDPYGQVAATTGSAASVFGYAGEYTDPDTGLTYLRARDYDPSTGQFLTRDPLEDTTSTPYTYTGGNPLQFRDPTGLDWLDNAAAWSASFGDTLTLGGTNKIRRLISYQSGTGDNDIVDHCNDFYEWGGYGGAAASLAPGGAAAAKATRLTFKLAKALKARRAAAAKAGSTGARATVHGSERLTQAGFTDDLIAQTRAGLATRQSDGANVFVREVTPGRFDYIVEGERGVVTAHRGWSQKSIDRLAKNYGWEGWPP